MSELLDPNGGNRHQGREVALQVLYAVDLAGHTSPRRAALREDGLADRHAADFAETDFQEGDGTSERDDGEAADVVAEPVRAAPTIAGSGQIFDRVAEHFVVPKGALEFARELVSGVVSRLPELDALVSLHARNWRVSRMAVVDRNVLRLGAHELRDTQTPVAVVIDEAVDLARRFGSDRSPAFVNGVLDAIAKEVRSA